MFSANYTDLQPSHCRENSSNSTNRFYSRGQNDTKTKEDLENMECMYEVRTGLIGYTDTRRIAQDSNYISCSIRNTIQFSRWGEICVTYGNKIRIFRCADE
jgi:hypothetical protein